MAIYNNREVTVIGPNPQAASPRLISIEYKDGQHENVALGRVRFTEAEKKALVKQHPGSFDNVDTIKDEDLKAVRIGVPPSYDKDSQDQALVRAQHQKQQEMAKQQADKHKAEADKKVNEQLNKNQTVIGTDRAGQQISKSGNVVTTDTPDARR